MGGGGSRPTSSLASQSQGDWVQVEESRVEGEEDPDDAEDDDDDDDAASETHLPAHPAPIARTPSEWQMLNEHRVLPTPFEACRIFVLLAVFALCLYTARFNRPKVKMRHDDDWWYRHHHHAHATELISGFATLVQTALGTHDRLAQKGHVAFMESVEAEGPTLDVGSLAGEPGLVGFGGAFTEAAASVFEGLRPELQQELLGHYFGPEGLGYSVGRVHINSCDFSLSSYSFDDTDGDFELAHFDDSLSRDEKVLIPFIKAATETLKKHGQDLRLFASPWSPPAWMKNNRQMDGTWDPCLRVEARSAWAQYISRWFTAYKNHGVKFWAMTVQNEPEWNDTRYEMCHFSPDEEAEFLGGFLGPALRSAHPDLAILVFDHNKQDVQKWARTLYNHPKAHPFVDGVAFHWYTGDHFQNVRKVRDEFPDTLLLPTEATYTSDRWGVAGDNLKEGDWHFGEGYAHDIIGDLNAGASGWVDWNLLLDERGGPNHAGNTCDAAVRANLSSQQIYLHPQYYFMGHFSKYILPGSRRLNVQITASSQYSGRTRPFGTCTSDDGLQATAFLRPDGEVATVVLNCGDSEKRFKLRDGSAGTIDAIIPGRAIQTYLYERAGEVPHKVQLV